MPSKRFPYLWTRRCALIAAPVLVIGLLTIPLAKSVMHQASHRYARFVHNAQVHYPASKHRYVAVRYRASRVEICAAAPSKRGKWTSIVSPLQVGPLVHCSG
jgi:hypothetical protein